MIPERIDESGTLEIKEEPSLTYKMHTEKEKIAGSTEGLEAVRQAVYKLLQTERYEYPVYSGDYGVELKDLYGQPMSYVCPELERRITEALLWDGRIERVEGFIFDTAKKGIVEVSFTVVTVFGELRWKKEVTV